MLVLSELFRAVFSFAVWTNLWHFGHPKGIKLQGFELNLEVLCTTLCTTSSSDFWFTESQVETWPARAARHHPQHIWHWHHKRYTNAWKIQRLQRLQRPAKPAARQDRKRSRSNHCSRDFWTVQSCGQYNDFSWRHQSQVRSEYEWRERCLIRSWGEVMIDGISWILNSWELLFLTSMVPPRSMSTSSRCGFHEFLIVTLI